ncbi:MAG TPA: hypothetical protein PLH39_00430, partial [Promineifilum sp.]|nr:hypothetical protein [Promineifilum sp.]
ASSSWVRARRKAVASLRAGWFSTARVLHRAGVLESPLVSVTGHGYHVYDSLVRVPLVIAGGPVAAAGRRVDQQARQIDIMPTILDLVGLATATPTTAEGRSLRPLMQGKALPAVPAFIETCQNSREPSSFYGIRHDGYKYAFDADNPKTPEELYDLSADPEETRNLAAVMPEKAAALRALIAGHLAQAGAAVSMKDEMSDKEMAGLAEHLRKLGYVE